MIHRDRHAIQLDGDVRGLITDERRKRRGSREIYGRDAVAPDSKAHNARCRGVQHTRPSVRRETEQVDAMDDRHGQRDQEQQQERDKGQERRNNPVHGV